MFRRPSPSLAEYTSRTLFTQAAGAPPFCSTTGNKYLSGDVVGDAKRMPNE